MYRYLALKPPRQQAAELLDVILHMVHVDDNVSEEEEIVLDELGVMITVYITASSNTAQYEVVIVPQQEAQKIKIKALLPGIEATHRHGGLVYPVGRFHSARFASMVSQKYVEHGLFTTRLES